jgi:hypothetical protein
MQPHSRTVLKRCIFNYYNFSKAQLASSLMMVVLAETCRSTLNDNINVNFNILLSNIILHYLDI